MKSDRRLIINTGVCALYLPCFFCFFFLIFTHNLFVLDSQFYCLVQTTAVSFPLAEEDHLWLE